MSLSSRISTINIDVVFRSSSGNRSSVVLQGQGMDGGVSHIFLVAASHITIADMSLGEVANHAIQVQGEQGADNLLVHNVRIFNTNEQMIKGSCDSDGGPGSGSDNGVVECSLFEYTDSFGPQYYIGGIDVHRGIGLESADHVSVFNNTIFFDHDYPNAIEYRFAESTGIEIINNLTNNAILNRGDASATVRNNVVTAESSWFVDAASGDLHLASDEDTVVAAGETLSDVDVDMDCNTRPQGNGYDIGADEY